MRGLLLSALLLATGPAGAQVVASGPAGTVFMTGGVKPLSVVLDALGRQVRPNVLVLPGVPDVAVNYSFTSVSPEIALATVATAHDLAYCLSDGLVLVGGRSAVERACAAVPGGAVYPVLLGDLVAPVSVTVEVPQPVAAPAAVPAVVAPPAPPAPQRVGVRLRIIELADNSSAAAGVDWSKGLLSGVVSLAAGALSGSVPSLSSLTFTQSLQALERQGLARKLDEVQLSLTVGQSTAFQSGGNLQLSLIGSGETKIERTIPYGLNLTLQPSETADGVQVAVNADLSNAVSTSNTSLLDVARRSVNTTVDLGSAPVLVAAWSAIREEKNGSGLPGLARIPFAGYVAGQADQSASRSTLVVTLERL